MEHHQLLLELYAAAQQCTRDEFHPHALGLVKQHLHFDSGAVLTAYARDDAGFTIHTMHLHHQPAEKLWVHEQLETPDYVLADALRQRGVPLARASADVFSHKSDFNDYCRRFDVAHTLILAQPPSGPEQYDLISLWRGRQPDAYTDDDSRAAAALLPHFFQARQINARLHADIDQDTRDGVSVLVGLSGYLHFLPHAAMALLREEWREWAPPRLPRQLLTALGGNQSLRYTGQRIKIQGKLLGRMLHLQVQRRLGAGLTAAERQVAELAADGMSYKEIARTVGSAPSTVRNQLHSVYGKLGIGNKAMLAAALRAAGA